jgi:hypothetical protein
MAVMSSREESYMWGMYVFIIPVTQLLFAKLIFEGKFAAKDTIKVDRNGGVLKFGK